MGLISKKKIELLLKMDDENKEKNSGNDSCW